MTAALDAIRARDAAWGAMTPVGPEQHGDMWTRDGLRDAYLDACLDRRYLRAALDRAEAVVAAADKVVRKPGANDFRDDWERLRAALRAYEDADKEGASRGA